MIDRLTTGNAIVVGSPISLEVLADLERDIGQPVLSSHQVAAWHALRTMGVEDSLAGLWPALFTAMSDNASVN
jgi:maleate cis-trans isomerase